MGGIATWRFRIAIIFPYDYNPSYYPQTKLEGYSFGVVRSTIRPFRSSTLFVCPEPLVRFDSLLVQMISTMDSVSQYLLVRFDSFLVQMISTMDCRYPISLAKIDPLTLELLPLFLYSNYKAKPILAFLCDDPHISSKLLYLTTSHLRP